MSSVWDMLSIVVAVPQWYLVAIGLASVLVSLGAFIVSNWLSYKWALVKVRSSGTVKPENVKGALVREDRDDLGQHQSVEASAHTEARLAILSNAQKKELLYRVEIGGGFLLADACSLLNKPQEEVIKLIQSGELAGYRDHDKRLWVSAQSLADRLMIDSNPAAKLEKPVASVASVPSRRKPQPPIRQHYWYYIGGDGGTERYMTLAETLSAIGYTGKATEWSELPASIRDQIRREKVG